MVFGSLLTVEGPLCPMLGVSLPASYGTLTTMSPTGLQLSVIIHYTLHWNAVARPAYTCDPLSVPHVFWKYEVGECFGPQTGAGGSAFPRVLLYPNQCFSALDVISNVMRSINPRFTYLLTYPYIRVTHFSEARIIFAIIGSTGNSAILRPSFVSSPRLFRADRA